MSKSSIGSISSSDLIDAKLEEHRMCGSKQCPSCGHKLERKPDWLGLPAGVKFDPTDQELIEHLEAKVESEQSKSHPLIDEFIPTIEGEDGICYTHPEKLPGVTKDGLSRHFFHRPSKAYTTGTRKRRKIQTECDLQGGETRWHKTGKTRPVQVNGRQKGCKKILVLYTNFGKHRKPEKTNWVMHQYHLGQLEEEREGELVVSKIFYQTQPRQCNIMSEKGAAAGSDQGIDHHHHRRESGGGGGGGSCSSKEVSHSTTADDLSGAVAVAGISGYTSMEIQQMKSDNFSFVPFRKSFDEVGIGEATKGREASSRTCEEHDQEQEHHQRPHHHMTHHDHHQHHHHHHQALQPVSSAASNYHVNRPSNPIATVVPLHQTSSSSIFLDDPYQVPTMILQSEKFQQHHHQKLAERSPASAGLEELIIGCTSVDMKEESSMTNPQETEWLKYPYWPDPDNPNHHG